VAARAEERYAADKRAQEALAQASLDESIIEARIEKAFADARADDQLVADRRLQEAVAKASAERSHVDEAAIEKRIENAVAAARAEERQEAAKHFKNENAMAAARAEERQETVKQLQEALASSVNEVAIVARIEKAVEAARAEERCDADKRLQAAVAQARADDEEAFKVRLERTVAAAIAEERRGEPVKTLDPIPALGKKAGKKSLKRESVLVKAQVQREAGDAITAENTSIDTKDEGVTEKGRKAKKTSISSSTRAKRKSVVRKRWSTSARAVPKLLRLSVPHAKDLNHCAGLYRLVDDRLVNGFPLWHLEGADRWIYSSIGEKAWMVGGAEEAGINFACDHGFITNGAAHDAFTPDQITTWYIDPDVEGHSTELWTTGIGITFTAVDPDTLSAAQASGTSSESPEVSRPVVAIELNSKPIESTSPIGVPELLRLSVPDDKYHVAGLYHRVEGRLVNGFPIWCHDGGDWERWLFSGLDARAWMIGGAGEAADNFACDSGFITNGEPHNGWMPDQCNSWLIDPDDETDDDWVLGREIRFERILKT
jgi:hypothetical protein